MRRLFIVVAVVVAALTIFCGPTPVVSAALADTPQFAVMNTDETPPDGVFFRQGPDASETDATGGFGVYAGEHVLVSCYWLGTPFGPDSNGVWYYAYDVERPIVNGQSNQGWINTHYVNDGMTAGNPNPSVPQCAARTDDGSDPGSASATTNDSEDPNSTLPEGASVFFQPAGHTEAADASLNVPYTSWASGDCGMAIDGSSDPVPDPYNGQWVSTLAGWSLGRLGPIYFLQSASSEQLMHIHYVLLIDPGDASSFAGCDQQVAPSNVLADWLGQNPANQLVIISAQATAADDHQGLQSTYLSVIKQAGLNSQVLVCNDDSLSHQDAFWKYAAGTEGISSYISAPTFSCPGGILGWQP